MVPPPPPITGRLGDNLVTLAIVYLLIDVWVDDIINCQIVAHFLQLLLVGHWDRKPTDFLFPLSLLLHTVYPFSACTLLLQDDRGSGDTHFNYFFYRHMVRRLDSKKRRAVRARLLSCRPSCFCYTLLWGPQRALYLGTWAELQVQQKTTQKHIL